MGVYLFCQNVSKIQKEASKTPNNKYIFDQRQVRYSHKYVACLYIITSVNFAISHLEDY